MTDMLHVNVERLGRGETEIFVRRLLGMRHRSYRTPGTNGNWIAVTMSQEKAIAFAALLDAHGAPASSYRIETAA